MDTLTLVISLAVARPGRPRRRRSRLLRAAGPAGRQGRRCRRSPTSRSGPASGRRSRPATSRSSAHRRAEPTARGARTETPEPVAGRMARLRARLGGSQSHPGPRPARPALQEQLDDAAWEEVEEVLLTADVGVGPTQELVERLRTRVKALGTRDTESRARPAARGAAHPGRPRRRPVAAHRPGRTAGRPSSSSSASTAPARPPPWASWPGSWWPRTAPCCSARPTPSARRPPTS